MHQFIEFGKMVAGGLLFVSTLFMGVSYTPRAGAPITTNVADFETSLVSSITANDTEMTLVSTSTRDGGALEVGKLYGFTVDDGTSAKEYVSGVVSSSRRIVSMTRGLSVVT